MLGSAAYPALRFLLQGDTALTVELGDRVDLDVNRRARVLSEALSSARIPGIVEVISAFCSFTVVYDPAAIKAGEIAEAILRIHGSGVSREEAPTRLIRVPVIYGGEYGPDLDSVAEYAGLTPKEVVQIHAKATYVCCMMGFLAGFPYLYGVPHAIAAPRLPTPRKRTAAGSVGIAQELTGIYPVESPGGWRIIGRTPLRLFDTAKQPPHLFAPGDLVRFVPVSEQEYQEVLSDVLRGKYRVKVEPGVQCE